MTSGFSSTPLYFVRRCFLGSNDPFQRLHFGLGTAAKVDKVEIHIPGITGGALDSHEELPGPIYLQGSEKGRVSYRSIIITPAEK